MVDYSKWKDIEISDDEDDTHPNIDTASLFRWRHQARVERMEEMRKEKEKLQFQKTENDRKLKDVRDKITHGKYTTDDELEQLKKQMDELLLKENEIQKQFEAHAKKEKLMPWNVDTISRDGFTKTVLNKPKPRQTENLTDEQKDLKYKTFVKENESLIKKFGMMHKYNDSKQFLQENPQLACEETANYLVIWCINLEVEGKHQLMEHVAHQCICMQYIMELAKQLDVDPRACISSFFSRIQLADPQYKEAFEEELRAFKERVRKSARIRLEKAMQEVEEEEKKKRLGPGGLDPVEVFETLPEPMKKCFEERDTAMLQKVISEMPEDEARYHMKRCVDSGLWIPDAKSAGEKSDG